MIYYQFRADRGRRTLRGIDEQVAKAAKAVAGLAPVKRNRFIQLDGATKKRQPRAGGQGQGSGRAEGYVTNLAACPDGTPVTADFVVGNYHRLWNVEKSFRMSKHDLRARLIYHRKRDSIEAHLTIVFALAVTRFIEDRTGWSIKKIRPHRAPLSHRPDPRRPPHPHRRRPAAARPPRRPRAHQVTRQVRTQSDKVRFHPDPRGSGQLP